MSSSTMQTTEMAGCPFSVARGTAWWAERRRLLADVQQDTQGRRWHLQSGLELDLACRLVEAHQRHVQDGTCISATRKRCISAVRQDGRAFIVKEFVTLPPFGLLRPDRRSWLCGNRLHGAVPYLGWLQEPRRGLIIMASAGEGCLDFRKRPYDVRLLLPKYVRVGELIARLHELNVFHADLKPSNFVADDLDSDSPRLTLIDCDDIRCPRRLTRRLIVKNLAQFLGGLSYSVPDESDRLLFARTVWDAYCGHRPTADRSLLVSAASLAIGLYPNRVSQVQTLFRHLE